MTVVDRVQQLIVLVLAVGGDVVVSTLAQTRRFHRGEGLRVQLALAHTIIVKDCLVFGTGNLGTLLGLKELRL